jgi:hypothetical protein
MGGHIFFQHHPARTKAEDAAILDQDSAIGLVAQAHGFILHPERRGDKFAMLFRCRFRACGNGRSGHCKHGEGGAARA